ncbi:MAG TPA: imidazoleglycerol-phosphate dehydratase HisB [bacterium]
MKRISKVNRKTKETDITIFLNIDGTGKYNIRTPVQFMNHMLELFAMHGLFDLRIAANGDVNVDDHHTVEDVGILLGQAFKKALDKRIGIRRYGNAVVPMDESLVQVSVDISGRSWLAYNINSKAKRIKNFDTGLCEDFWIAFVNNAGMTVHLNEIYGRNTHHVLEATFKGMGMALGIAASVDIRRKRIPSTKGTI